MKKLVVKREGAGNIASALPLFALAFAGAALWLADDARMFGWFDRMVLAILN